APRAPSARRAAPRSGRRGPARLPAACPPNPAAPSEGVGILAAQHGVARERLAAVRGDRAFDRLAVEAAALREERDRIVPDEALDLLLGEPRGAHRVRGAR